jgi:hypothetical protein
VVGTLPWEKIFTMGVPGFRMAFHFGIDSLRGRRCKLSCRALKTVGSPKLPDHHGLIVPSLGLSPGFPCLARIRLENAPLLRTRCARGIPRDGAFMRENPGLFAFGSSFSNRCVSTHFDFDRVLPVLTGFDILKFQ